MKKLNLKAFPPLIVMLLCMALIFGFSSQNGNDSSSISSTVTNKIIPLIFRNYYEQSNEVRAYVFYEIHRIIRKIAHFTLFYILGGSIYISVFIIKNNIKDCFKYSLGIPFIYAVTDEFHQLFSSERTAKITDVIIDESGAVCGLLTVFIIISCISYVKKL